ncbi:tubulin gamma-2 chain-like [Macrosteles quadrilineatus]|uniref:tubulin gamma-2 chain-like n=1 Tax=Macrosteles quadrilineatus TaxID=74068 RepID=UPI0023E1E0F7|nr:tubulin gamma-2 chain-like [Macrosteles quadrilineatus]
MSKQILSFQIGQCGNSIGLQFWQNMALEHGLNLEGQIGPSNFLQGIDNKNSFFHELDSGLLVPRCIMLDLEPRVIHNIRNSACRKLFDAQNMFIGQDGGGAGNNWATGFNQSQKYKEILLDLIQRETETMDCLEGFLITHAISGGTGAGMGSSVLELLTEVYPKKTIQTYSVFPTSVSQVSESGLKEGQYTDVVIEPYNSLLTLMRLTNYADSVIVLDNLALHNKTSKSNFLPLPSFANINKVASDVMTASLGPIRYPGMMFNSLSEVVLALTPAPKFHFLMTGYTPLRSFNSPASVNVVKTSIESVLSHLGKMNNMLVSIKYPKISRHGYISVFNVIQGNSHKENLGVLKNSRQEFLQKASYLAWAKPMSLYQTTLCPWSPYQTHPNRVSGLSMVNHSAIVSFFYSTLTQFGKLYSRKAYITQMMSLSGFDDLENELELCKTSCEDLILEYESALTSNYSSNMSN